MLDNPLKNHVKLSIDICDSHKADFPFWLLQDLSQLQVRVVNFYREFLIDFLTTKKIWESAAGGDIVDQDPQSPKYSFANFSRDQILMVYEGSMESHS